MIVAKWKLELIVGFWLDNLRESGIFEQKKYSIQSGSWCSVGTEKKFQWRYGNIHPEDGIKEHIIGWEYVYDKNGSVEDQRIEIYTGVELDEEVIAKDPNGYYRELAEERRSNVNIVMRVRSLEMDDLSKFEAFSREDMDTLFEMLKDPDKTLDEYYKKHPKFEYDMLMNVDGYTMRCRNDRHTKIKFVATNKVFPKEGLFIGFEGREDDGSPRYYVFKVVEKSRNFNGSDKAFYTAEFHGYFTPTEEEIENASFQWVVNEEIIKTAEHEACLN